MNRTRLSLLALLLVFWCLTLWNLGQFPTIQYDEPSILAPGYYLFTHGVYGSPMFTGFYGQERLYLEVTPLMSLLQGVSGRLLGIGVWQMRFVPAAAGLLTLALTYALACAAIKDQIDQRAGSRVGVLAVALLLLWPWRIPALPFSGSGIPLIDIARIARYDMLVPVFGLGALLAYHRARQNAGLRLDGLSGLLAGLAGQANVYGLLWVGVLLSLHAIDRRVKTEPVWHGPVSVLMGAGLVWIGWLAISLLNWTELQSQFSKHTADGRFDFWSLSFYLDSLLREPHRYGLILSRPATYLNPGSLLLLLGLPLATLMALGRFIRGEARSLLLLLGPALLFPLIFALLVNTKRPFYLATVAPLFALLIGWLIVTVSAGRVNSRRRLIPGLLISAVFMHGAFALITLHRSAAQALPPATFFRQLTQTLPPTGRILGPPEYWLGLPGRDYRSLALPFLLANPRDPAAPTFAQALTTIAPDIILLHPSFTAGLDTTTRYYRLPTPRREVFQQFMLDHQAEIIGHLTDFNGAPVTVYRLQW